MSATTALQPLVEQFLDERHQLGFDTRTLGHVLRSFAHYVDGLGLLGPLGVDVMASWARCPKNGSDDPKTWARRLRLLRPFTRWLRQFEPRTAIPDDTVFGSADARLAPHIYTDREIADLLAAAHRLQPPLRGATYQTLFGLLAATGLRVSEAVHLCNSDVDLNCGLLTVRETKFAKSRQIPVHPTTLEALRRYRIRRDGEVMTGRETPFFVGTRGRRCGCTLSTRQVDRVFQKLREELAWTNRGGHATPRIHDLRHNSASRIIPSPLLASSTDGGSRARWRTLLGIIRGSSGRPVAHHLACSGAVAHSKALSWQGLLL
jgi:integrase